MKKHRIAWLPGDGIGQEVCEAARVVLDAAGFEAEYIHGDIGWEFWRKEGDALPQRTLDLLQSTDCAFFGAITSKPVKDAASANSRPSCRAAASSTAAPSCACASCWTCTSACARAAPSPAIRSTIATTSTSSSSAKTPRACTSASNSRVVPEVFFQEPGMARIPRDAAISIRSVTRQASLRIVEAAFEYAVKHNRRKVTAVHKANVLRAT